MIIHKKRLKLNYKPDMYIKTACKFKILKIYVIIIFTLKGAFSRYFATL